jgi:RND family efflux transporter MFP subunit
MSDRFLPRLTALAHAPSCLTALFVILILCSPTLAGEDLTVKPAIKDLTMTGYTRCHKAVTLSAEVPGKALRVNYKTGDVIGDKPFIEIDPTFITLSIETNALQISQIDRRLRSMESSVHFLNNTLKRVKALRQTQNVTEVQYDEAASRFNEAFHELEALKLEKKMLNLAKKRLNEELARHTVYGFKGGRVTALLIEEGESIQPGMPLAEISDYSTLVVPFSLSGEEVTAFKNLPEPFEGMLDETPVKAAIHVINPRFDENTRKLNIELAVRDYNGDRRGGLKFTTRIKVRTDGILIPKQAVRNRFGNPKVTLKTTGKQIPVMILGENGDHLIAAIHDQLSPGTLLVAAEHPGSGDE